MRLHRSILIVAFAFTLTACGSPKSFDVRVRGPMHTQQAQPVNVMSAADTALFARSQAITFIAAGNHAKEQPHRIPVEPSSVVSPTPPMTTVPAATSSLPPDWVIQRESGGDYNAFNRTGCGGLGCFGRYQFSGAWAGKLGLPLDLSTATPEQQDAAARELWAGGAGRSHWAACN